MRSLACLAAILALGALACDLELDKDAVGELREELRPLEDRANEAVNDLHERTRNMATESKDAVEELREELRPLEDRVNETVNDLRERTRNMGTESKDAEKEPRPLEDRVNEALNDLPERTRKTVTELADPSPPIRTASKFDPELLATEITQAINAHRLEHGRVALTVDPLLTEIAQAHSANMAQHGYSAHVDTRGDDPTGRARKVGYDCHNPRSIGIAENIHVLYGHTSPLRTATGTVYSWESNAEMVSRFVADWLGSPGHLRNIMDQRYTLTGVGVAFGTFRGIPHAIHVTQNFC